jgi:hypothetical protein
LQPSEQQAILYLTGIGKTDWLEEITSMIHWHHKFTTFLGKHQKTVDVSQSRLDRHLIGITHLRAKGKHQCSEEKVSKSRFSFVSYKTNLETLFQTSAEPASNVEEIIFSAP